MPKRIWRGGMIGAGAWSDIQLTAWAGVPNAQIVALTDRHPDRRQPVVDRFQIPQAFNDYETMLDEAELDFVDICTRPYSHVLLAKPAADRGIPVLCQKPFCETLGEAIELTQYFRERGVRLMVNENFRWQAWFRKIKEILEAGALGQPFFAKFHQRHRITLPVFNHDQPYFSEMPRLIVYEVGVHLLDVSRFLFGEPETVYARLHHISPHVIGEDVQVITLSYPNLTVIIHDSWASIPIPGLDRPKDAYFRYPRLVEIDGTKGTIYVDANGTLTLFTDDSEQSWQFGNETLAQSQLAAQQHFIDCLENGEEFETTGEETIKTMALVYGAYKSAAEGRVVETSEMLPEIETEG